MIGDSKNDILEAQHANMESIGVTYVSTPRAYINIYIHIYIYISLLGQTVNVYIKRNRRIYDGLPRTYEFKP